MEKKSASPILAAILAVLVVGGVASDAIATITTSRPHPSILHFATAELASSPLLVDGELSEPAAALFQDEEGLEFLSLIANCALRLDVVVDITDVIQLLGDVGAAPGWLHRPMRAADRRRVSTCLLARVDGLELALTISLRAPFLRRLEGERAAFSKLEGGYAGDVFGGVQLACGVSDPPADRVCAVPDPRRPGLTLCGFTYLGLCSQVCLRIGDEFLFCVHDGELVLDVASVWLP